MILELEIAARMRRELPLVVAELRQTGIVVMHTTDLGSVSSGLQSISTTHRPTYRLVKMSILKGEHLRGGILR